MVFAITEGGETSFVIGTAWQGLEAGARVVFVYNNPDEVLRAHVTRSREVIDEPRIRKVNLTTGPMAITGSTRMQATSIELLAMLTVLEMALRELLARDGARGARRRPRRATCRRRCGTACARSTPSSRASACAARSRASSRPRSRSTAGGSRTSYFADSLGVDVLTDTTERSPTFCTPVVPEVGRRGGLGVVGVPLHAGRRRPRRPGRACCGASRRRSSGRRTTCARCSTRRPRRGRARSCARSAGASCCASGSASTASPTVRHAPATASRRWWRSATCLSWRTGGAFARQLARARAAGAAGAVIAVGRGAALARLTATAGGERERRADRRPRRARTRRSCSTRSRASA